MENVPKVSGKLLLPREAKSHSADVFLWPGGRLELTVQEDPEFNRRCSSQDYKFGAVIPGLPVDVKFNDGALFTPNDNSHRWQSKGAGAQKLLSFLEKNKLIIIFATLLVPLSFWWVVTRGIPFAVDKSVVLVPDLVSQRMGKDALAFFDKIYLEESKLSSSDKRQVELLWSQVLDDLRLPKERYRLHFRASEDIGANAFALPNGAVVVTDEIVTLMQENPDAMVSVLLHEIGHVEHKHSLKLIGRSVSTTILFTVFLGDIEGIGEALLGAGSSLASSSFSREMEHQADEFAFDKLEQMGTSPSAFAEAMTMLKKQRLTINDDEDYVANIEEHGQDADGSLQNDSWNSEDTGGSKRATRFSEYFNSHPLTQDRIDAAIQRGKEFADSHIK